MNTGPDMDGASLIAEVGAAAEALRGAEARRLAAVRAAFEAGVSRADIAVAAGLSRDGVYKLVARASS